VLPKHKIFWFSFSNLVCYIACFCCSVAEARSLRYSILLYHMSVSDLPMICVQPYPQTSTEVPEVLEILRFCRGMKFDCLDVFVFSLIWGFSSGVTVVSKQANNTLPCFIGGRQQLRLVYDHSSHSPPNPQRRSTKP
jgi:hypothetical protein